MCPGTDHVIDRCAVLNPNDWGGRKTVGKRVVPGAAAVVTVAVRILTRLLGETSKSDVEGPQPLVVLARDPVVPGLKVCPIRIIAMLVGLVSPQLKVTPGPFEPLKDLGEFAGAEVNRLQ